MMHAMRVPRRVGSAVLAAAVSAVLAVAGNASAQTVGGPAAPDLAVDERNSNAHCVRAAVAPERDHGRAPGGLDERSRLIAQLHIAMFAGCGETRQR